MYSENPLISIITVSYNAVESIEETILSVINQTYSNIEYIIIDGGSTDGTVDIIKKYSDKIAYWVSESDKGIYDAMNKGIKVASGEWINFMNSGDSFFDNNVVKNLINRLTVRKSKILYGDTYFKKGTDLILNKAKSLSYFRKGMPFCHQSVFVSSDIIIPFNLNFKIAADYNFFYFLYINYGGIIFDYIDLPIAKYDINGISSDVVKAYKEYIHIRNEKFFKIKIFLFSKLYPIGKKIKSFFKLKR